MSLYKPKTENEVTATNKNIRKVITKYKLIKLLLNWQITILVIQQTLTSHIENLECLQQMNIAYIF